MATQLVSGASRSPIDVRAFPDSTEARKRALAKVKSDLERSGFVISMESQLVKPVNVMDKHWVRDQLPISVLVGTFAIDGNHTLQVRVEDLGNISESYSKAQPVLSQFKGRLVEPNPTNNGVLYSILEIPEISVGMRALFSQESQLFTIARDVLGFVNWVDLRDKSIGDIVDKSDLLIRKIRALEGSLGSDAVSNHQKALSTIQRLQGDCSKPCKDQIDRVVVAGINQTIAKLREEFVITPDHLQSVKPFFDDLLISRSSSSS